MAIKIVASVASLSIPEGTAASFRVRLSARPPADTTVSISRTSGSASIRVKTTSLTFTPSNWRIGQKVVVKALVDPDRTNDQATITLSGEGLLPATVEAVQVDTKPEAVSTRVVIDPVTRIEGHLKIETLVDNGKVADAWSTATLFRGIERILTGRAPTDAPIITQRLCGVCTYIHALTSSRCLENAYAVNLPDNARIVRNLLLGAQFVHDHIVHFYHLSAMDWVDVVSALAANPDETAKLAHPSAAPIDFAAVRDRLAGLVSSGQLGPFKNAYWGHTAYRFSPEQNLLLVAHYLEALKKQAEYARLHALLGGKNPHPHSVVVGGVTCAGELGRPSTLNNFYDILQNARDFVATVYLPDVMILGKVYKDWSAIGGFDNLLSYGEFPSGPREPEHLFLPRGIVRNRNLSWVEPVDLQQISEHVAHSWYEGGVARHPLEGETIPGYSGYDINDRYSWLKAPRYDNVPMEVGPLARTLVAFAAGHEQTVDLVNQSLGTLGLTAGDMFSVLGRTMARAVETQVIADAMVSWVEELQGNIDAGYRQVYERYTAVATSQGVGLNEAPRGALGHWAEFSGDKIGNYQMVVPSTWNFGPRCAAGLPGPVEQALVGTPVADPAKPLELLRVLHSFDPCIACGVHVIDPRGGCKYEVRIL